MYSLSGCQVKPDFFYKSILDKLNPQVMKDENYQPFYLFEKVIAVDAIQGSIIKNGKVYTILSCEYVFCRNGNAFFWYVGVEGSHNRLRPSIFASINRPAMMTFEKITESIHAN